MAGSEQASVEGPPCRCLVFPLTASSLPFFGYFVSRFCVKTANIQCTMYNVQRKPQDNCIGGRACLGGLGGGRECCRGREGGVGGRGSK